MEIEPVFDRDGKGFTVSAAVSVPNDNITMQAKAVKAAIRRGLLALMPAQGECLGAAFAGPRHPRADVENLLFNNIDQWGDVFAVPAAHGMLFEDLGEAAPGPDPYLYRYRLRPGEDPFLLLETSKAGPAWALLEMVGGPASRLTARTWWTMRHADLTMTKPLSRAASFAVQLKLSGSDLTPAKAIKSLIDGVVAAFQVQTDLEHAVEAAHALARYLPGSEAKITKLLTSHPNPVLGETERLLWLKPASGDIQWNPDDARCIAGSVLHVEGSSGPIAFCGRLLEASVPERIT